jgi:ACT domain-containing protein
MDPPVVEAVHSVHLERVTVYVYEDQVKMHFATVWYLTQFLAKKISRKFALWYPA